MSDDLVEMARLAQHDERMSTGALYGDLADRIEELEELLWAAEKDASEAEAYAGELEAKLSESEALLAKAVKLIELAIELGRWELNPSFRDELIAFTAELTSSVAADNQVKGGKHD